VPPSFGHNLTYPSEVIQDFPLGLFFVEVARQGCAHIAVCSVVKVRNIMCGCIDLQICNKHIACAAELFGGAFVVFDLCAHEVNGIENVLFQHLVWWAWEVALAGVTNENEVSVEERNSQQEYGNGIVDRHSD
jgi:hypothetical protein